jgi:hypothetical protein
MPTDISTTATDAFTGVVNAPASGDPRTAASVSTMGQALADRSLWTWKRFQSAVGKWAPLSTDIPVRLSSVDIAADTITLAGHGLVNADQVRFDGSGTPPTPLAIGTMYYVVGATANTFQLSLTSGGAVVNLGGSLIGTVYVIKVTDPGIFLPDALPLLGGSLSSRLALFAAKSLTNVFVGTNSFGGATLFQGSGQILNAGLLSFLGGGARIIWRAPSAISGAADAQINMANTDHFTIDSLTANRIYTLNQATGTAPIAYERKRITVENTNGHNISFRREGSVANIASYSLGGSVGLECEFYHDGTNWRGSMYCGGIVPGAEY